MNITPSNSPEEPPPHKRVRLAPIAVALVVIIIIAFGVCAANLNFEGSTPPIASAAIGVEIVCLIGLVILFIVAIVRNLKSNR